MASRCDETAHLLPRERKARSSLKLVHPERLRQAVSRYLDLQALCLWASLASDHCPRLPDEVVVELDHQYPGFLGAGGSGRKRDGSAAVPPLEQLMNWAVEHYFQDAKVEGWFDAVSLQTQNHPRAIRTREYADQCKKCWSAKEPNPYPSFVQWRHDADSYIEVEAGGIGPIGFSGAVGRDRGTMPEMLKVDVAGYLPSTPASPYD